MGFFQEKVMAERNKIREQKGQRPVEVKEEPVKKKVLATELVTADVITEERDPLVFENEPRTKEHGDWQQTMYALTPLEAVYGWSESVRPGVIEKLSNHEDQCRNAALDGHPEEYQRLKQGYLKAVGNLCQLYWIAHHKVPLDVLVLGLGGKTLRIYPQAGTFPDSDSPPAFYACEIPALLTIPKSEFMRIFITKETMPGSLISYST